MSSELGELNLSLREFEVSLYRFVHTKQRDENNYYTRGNVTSWLCFDYCTRGGAQWVFIQSLGLASAHVEEFAECCSEEGRGVLAYDWRHC